MQRKLVLLALLAALFASLLGVLGAMPRQGPTPPPFYPDYFSGNLTVQGRPAPVGTQLFACIDDCGKVFQSVSLKVEEGGKYSGLVVNPADRALVGHAITFYLANQFGRIRAVETANFSGGLNPPYILNLTFNSPLPTLSPTPVPSPTPTPAPTATPRPTPSLPVTGDATAMRISKLLLGLGAAALLGSLLLLLMLRRRVL